jgi:acyl-CoA reductase-like NAD-dependent aldehyde dehydrogenase
VEQVPEGFAVVVHTLSHAIGALRAASQAGRSVVLLSAADAGIYAGPGWFAALVEAARQAAPEAHFSALLDCGDRPGDALGAIRAHIEAVIFTGRADVSRRLAEIASRCGVRLVTTRPAANLDLGDSFFASEAESEELCAQCFTPDNRGSNP